MFEITNLNTPKNSKKHQLLSKISQKKITNEKTFLKKIANKKFIYFFENKKKIILEPKVLAASFSNLLSISFKQKIF